MRAALNAFSLDWARFLPVAFLLLFPLPLLFARKTQYRALDENWAHYTAKGFTFPWHWLDVVRAFVGTWLLLQVLAINPPEYIAPKLIYGVFGLVLVLAVTLQTVVCRSRGSFHAPFGFVIGVLIAVLSPIAAGLTLLSAFTVALAFRAAPAFFGAAAVAAPIFGYFFFPYYYLLPPLTAMSGIPLLLPVLFQREFVLAHRHIRETHEDHGPLR